MAQSQTWTPQCPQINDADILAYSQYLIEYANAAVKPKWFCDTLDSFFNMNRADEVVDGKTRGQWIDAHKKRFAILEVGTYELLYCPDGYYESDGHIEISTRCVLDKYANYISVPWGHIERLIDVEATHSELEIAALGLPMFSQSEHCKCVRRE